MNFGHENVNHDRERNVSLSYSILSVEPLWLPVHYGTVQYMYFVPFIHVFIHKHELHSGIESMQTV